MKKTNQELWNFFATADDQKLIEWLTKYLCLKPTEPKLHIPDSFRDGATYLVSLIVSRKDVITANRISGIVYQILDNLSSSNASLSAVSKPQFISHLLFLIEGMGCSQETREQFTSLLDKIRRDEQLVGWPSADLDIHREVLLALGNVIIVKSPQTIADWENCLEADLENPQYTVAAFNVLFRIDALRAIHNQLCVTIRILKSVELGTADLIFWLAYQTTQDESLCETIKEVLRSGEANEELGQFLKDLDKLRSSN